MRKLYRDLTIVMVLILISGSIHIFAAIHGLFPSENVIILFLYMMAILILINIAKKSILHKDTLRNFKYIAYLLIIYLSIRTIRYAIAPQNPVVARYIWYSYYVLIFLIGVAIYFSILYMACLRVQRLRRFGS